MNPAKPKLNIKSTNKENTQYQVDLVSKECCIQGLHSANNISSTSTHQRPAMIKYDVNIKATKETKRISSRLGF
jgi:hypothetical protein